MLFLQLQEIASEYAESSQSSHADTPQSSQSSHASILSSVNEQEYSVKEVAEEAEQIEEETVVTAFEEVEIRGETFVLVPKNLCSYVPTTPVEIQHIEGIGAVEVGSNYTYIPSSMLPKVASLISKSVDLQQEVAGCRHLLWTRYGKKDELPPFDPKSVKEVCQSAGSNKLFKIIMEGMSSEEHSSSRESMNEKKAVAIIYMMMFGQSQKASWFQRAISSEVAGRGISETGLNILNKSGIAISKSTQRRVLYKTAANHGKIVSEFIDEATQNKDLLVLMIDDYTNIHTKQRPSNEETSTARSMATILLKRFSGVPAIPAVRSAMNPAGVSSELLVELYTANLLKLSSTFAASMPFWIRAAFFDPEMERKRLEVHDYQQDQSSARAMRKMKDCRLIDELELPLKSFENFLQAASHAVKCGLDHYLSLFICPQPGDWPAQFYMRQIQYHIPDQSPQCLQNVVPFIGPLHMQLNSRECVCVLNIEFFKKAYSYIFGERKILANKPKAWRISLIEELLYGGWTLIRDQVVVAFSNCKDVQYLTLLNLLDNYLPLVLSIYSVIFKCGNSDQYVDSVLRCWMMFFCFKRHHYDKAPLIWLSNFLYWKSIDHPLFYTITQSLNAFDEYPVENFHSILRAQTSHSDNGELLRQKARALDSNKATSGNFSSVYAVPKRYAFSRGRLDELKLSAAKFICSILHGIKEHPNSAQEVPRPKRKPKSMTYWKLPNLYGEETVVASKILPLGFQFQGKEPNPNKFVQF